MGLYGSPDLSKKYGNMEEYEKQKKKRNIKISIQTVVLVLMYLLLIINNNDNKLVTTASYIGLLSMVYFIINFVLMIYNLIKKRSVNKQVITILICIALFAICGMLI